VTFVYKVICLSSFVQSYDVRKDIKVDCHKFADLGEDQRRRQHDREAWARQGEREYQERMKAFKEKSRLARELLEQREREALQQKAMVEEMLQELCRQNPEWEARKKSVQRVS